MTVLTVTLNAAIDKRYDVTSITVGQVQRVRRVLASAGGKGLNAARGAQLCGQSVVATGFVGGFAGQFVTSEVTAHGMRDEFIRVAGETRTCINLIDAAGTSTEFLEPGVTVTADDLSRLLARFEELLPAVDVVTLSGSVPSGCPVDSYAQLIETTTRAGKPVILDTGGDLLLAGIDAAPTVITPNRDELAAIVGVSGGDLRAVVDAARGLCARGPEWVVVTLGGDGAVAVNADDAIHVLSPEVTVVNAVGCGDVLVGALASGLARGQTIDQALPLAVRVSAAAAAHPETGRFDPAYAETLDVTATRLRRNQN